MSSQQFSFDFGALALRTVEEIFATAEIDLLRSIREDRRIERKAPGISARSLGEYVSMWANTAGGGLIVVGMEDDGAPTGCLHLSVESVNEIERCGVVFAPQAQVSSRRVEFVDASGLPNYLILLHVRYHPNRVVETTSGEVYHRVGASKTKLRTEEIRNLEIDKGQVDFEQESTGLGLEDLEEEDVEAFVAAVKGTTGVEDRSAAEILSMRHLGKIEHGRFIANVAGTLAFARDPLAGFPGCKIRFLRFEGEAEGTGSKFNVTKDFMAEGSVPRQISRMAAFIDTQLREFQRLDQSMKFFKVAEYPRDAWYEAIVNACVHRSYSLKNMPIFVKMFDDRLTIESPGGLPPTVTPANIYESHHPRNPHLMNALMMLQFVRCMNEGTRRMRDSMVSMDLPAPVFEEKGGASSQVRVTLRNNAKQRRVWIDTSAAHIVGPELAATLNETEHRVINYIAEHGSINVTQLMRICERGWGPCKKLLVGLTDRGMLQRLRNPRLDRDGKARFVLAKGAGSTSESGRSEGT